MVPRGTRRELGDSFRLLAGEERWLFAGLAGGSVGYLIWVAGTGAAFEPVAGALADTLSVDRRTVQVWAFAFLWVFLPSVVAARYVVDHLTNLRGNVEQWYRVDQPLTLLGPPALFVLGAVVFAAIQGEVGTAVLVALGGANVVLLVRTVAYGYRVYSLSVPRALQGLLVVAAVAMSLGVVCRIAPLAGQEALVESMADRYGVGGGVTLGASSVPVLEVAGALAPGIVALAYVWVQIFASLVVRMQGPDVPRSAIRAGQRYPQFVQPGTDRRLAMGTVPEPSEADSDDEGAGEPSTETQEETGPGSGTGAAGTGSGPDAADGERAAASGGDQEFGQTRVYTPPEDEEEAEVVVKSELCPICGDTYDAGAGYTNCPNCNAVLDQG
jgi:hypothetical protein